MIKIKENQPFQLGNRAFTYTIQDGKIQLVPGKKLKEFSTPLIQEVIDYFKANGYSSESAIKFHAYYSSSNWKDGKGNAVKNWKQKAIGVWFTEQNKDNGPTPQASQMIR